MDACGNWLAETHAVQSKAKLQHRQVKLPDSGHKCSIVRISTKGDVYLSLLLGRLEPGPRARYPLLLWEGNEVQASQERVPLLGRISQDDIVDFMLVDLATAVQLECTDPVKNPLSIPWYSRNAMHTPPHPAGQPY